MGDHAPREMTVPAPHSAGQNPAYRPVAPLSPSPPPHSVAVVSLRTPSPTVALLLASAALLAACARPTPAPVPVPATPTAEPPTGAPPAVAAPPASAPRRAPRTPHGGPWTFTLAPGTVSYDMAEDARVATLPDTSAWRTLPALAGRVTLLVGADGATTVVQPPAVGPGTPCDSPGVALPAALVLRARTLIPAVPESLTAGATWRDSSTTTGCRGPVLATATVHSTYRVIGDTTTATGTPAVLVARADSLTATGEGAAGPHRILLRGTGTADADLLLDPAAGRLLSVSSQQHMLLDVTTSGRTSHFLQRSSTRATLADTSTTPPTMP